MAIATATAKMQSRAYTAPPSPDVRAHGIRRGHGLLFSTASSQPTPAEIPAPLIKKTMAATRQVACWSASSASSSPAALHHGTLLPELQVSCHSPGDILRLVRAQGTCFSAPEAALALHHYAQHAQAAAGLIRSHHPDFAMLMALVAEHVQAFSAPERASVLWSYAHMGLQPARHTLQQLLPLPSSQPCNLSSASSAWLSSDQPAAAQAQTNNRHPDSRSTHSTPAEAVHGLGISSPQTAAVSFYRAADHQETDEVPASDWRSKAASEAAVSGQPPQLHPLRSPQHIASFVWACAERGHCPGSSLMSAAVVHFHSSLAEASSPELASFLAACARVAFRPSYAFLAAATAAWVRKLMESADPQDIADYVWACASLGFQPGHAFLGAAAAQVHSRLPDADVQALCNLVWAYARLGYQPGDAFDADARDQMQEMLQTC